MTVVQLNCKLYVLLVPREIYFYVRFLGDSKLKQKICVTVFGIISTIPFLTI